MEIRIRRARLPDVPAIVAVTKEFGSEGIMIPLSIGDTLERIRSFSVACEVDGSGAERIIGCIAVDATWDLLVEIRSLAVERSRHGTGVGKLLLDAALRDAKEFGAREVFTLTYVPGFFAKFGFEEVNRDSLPHKVWLVCVKCPKFPDCGETAMKKVLA